MDHRLTLSLPGAVLRLDGPLRADVPGAAPACALGGTLALDTAASAPEVAVAVAEETTLRVWLDADDATDAPVAVRHADPVLLSDLRSERGGRLVHGRLGVGSHVGRTRIEVVRGDRVLGGLDVDVVPTKATAADVAAMRAEVEAAWAGLSLAAVRPSTGTFATAEGMLRPEALWLAVLDRSLGALGPVLAEIGRRPLREVRRAPEPVVTARAARLRPSEATALARRAGASPEGWPARVEVTVPRETDDTPSLRWLATRTRMASVRLDRLAALAATPTPSARRRALLGRIDEAAAALRRLRTRAPLAGVDGPAPTVPPLALRRRPAHRRAYDALRALDRGLDLAEDDLRLALRDLAGLYEAWCALAVAHALGRALGAEPPRLALRRSGLDVRLRRGTAAVTGRGVTATLRVQPRFGGAPALLVQRPDLVLTLRGPAGTRRLALDAKYRRDDAPGTVRRFGGPAPPAEALGTLHRYRDAVLGPDGERGWLDAAVALFPHRPAPAAPHEPSGRLDASIATLGVGAVPLLPGATGRLDALLDRLVSAVGGG